MYNLCYIAFYISKGGNHEFFRRTNHERWHCKRGECAEGRQLFEPSDGY